MTTIEYRRLTAKFIVTAASEIEPAAATLLGYIAAGREFQIHEMRIHETSATTITGPAPAWYEVEATASIVELT